MSHIQLKNKKIHRFNDVIMGVSLLLCLQEKADVQSTSEKVNLLIRSRKATKINKTFLLSSRPSSHDII